MSHGRLQSGRGQHIDVSVAEAAANVGGYAIPFYSYFHQKVARVTHSETSFELHDVYECKDGYVRLFIVVREHWRTFVEWIGSPPELCDPIFEDQEIRRDEWEASREGVPHSPVKGRSMPRVARWLDQIRNFFPKDVVVLLQQDAIERRLARLTR